MRLINKFTGTNKEFKVFLENEKKRLLNNK